MRNGILNANVRPLGHYRVDPTVTSSFSSVTEKDTHQSEGLGKEGCLKLQLRNYCHHRSDTWTQGSFIFSLKNVWVKRNFWSQKLWLFWGCPSYQPSTTKNSGYLCIRDIGCTCKGLKVYSLNEFRFDIEITTFFVSLMSTRDESLCFIRIFTVAGSGNRDGHPSISVFNIVSFNHSFLHFQKSTVYLP